MNEIYSNTASGRKVVLAPANTTSGQVEAMINSVVAGTVGSRMEGLLTQGGDVSADILRFLMPAERRKAAGGETEGGSKSKRNF